MNVANAVQVHYRERQRVSRDHGRWHPGSSHLQEGPGDAMAASMLDPLQYDLIAAPADLRSVPKSPSPRSTFR